MVPIDWYLGTEITLSEPGFLLDRSIHKSATISNWHWIAVFTNSHIIHWLVLKSFMLGFNAVSSHGWICSQLNIWSCCFTKTLNRVWMESSCSGSAIEKFLVPLTKLWIVLWLIGNSDLLNFFGNATQDSDFRVRIAAIKALFALHSECVPLWQEPFYQFAVILLSDVYVEVQVEALMLFWYATPLLVSLLTCRLLSNLFSSKLVSINNAPPVNLIDYAFKKLCSCVTDVSPAVRTIVCYPYERLLLTHTQACRLLGSLRNINHDLIIQTMSKTVLNDDVERNEGDLDKQTSMTEFFGKAEAEPRDAMTAMVRCRLPSCECHSHF